MNLHKEEGPEKVVGERQELDENIQRACRNNKQDRIPRDQAVTTLSEISQEVLLPRPILSRKIMASRIGLGSC